MRTGWIKLHRKVLDCWIWQVKEPFDRRSAWVDLLMLAEHHDKQIFDKKSGKIIEVKRGSYMTSVLKLADRWLWSKGKTDRYLKLLESERMITTERTPLGTLVTIVKYEDFQSRKNDSDTTDDTTNGTPIGATDDTTDNATVGTTHGQHTDNTRTTDGTGVDTQIKNIKNNKNIKENKEIKEDKNKRTEEIKHIVEYLNQKCGTNFRPNNKQTQEHINARFNDGYVEDDFYTVIDKKCAEWQGTEMEKFLRPITLFSTKFESYLNQNNSAPKSQTAQMLENHYSMVDEWVRQKEMEEMMKNDI